MSGSSLFGQQLTKGFDQLKQGGQGQPQPSPDGKQQGMMIPGFQYDPNKGLTVNLGNELLANLMQSMGQPQGQPQGFAQARNMPPQIMQQPPQQQNTNFLRQNPNLPA